MKQVIADLADEQAQRLEKLAQDTGLPVGELVARSVAEYLARAERDAVSLTGFGMWKDREDMADSSQWVADFRKREWA